MDVDTLAGAYRRLTSAARRVAGSDALSTADWAQIDWTLSHVLLSDAMLAETARRMLAGEPASIDNSGAMDTSAISTLIDTTSHAERIVMVSDNADRLVELIGRMPGESAAVMVPTRLVDRAGKEVLNDTLRWGDLVKARSTEQIPGHAARLEGYARTAMN